MKFNKWSLERIRKGTKILTSRTKAYPDDPMVKDVIGLIPWKFIKHCLYKLEGAESPEELQRVINKIFRRKVQDDKMLFVHEINVEKVLEVYQ